MLELFKTYQLAITTHKRWRPVKLYTTWPIQLIFSVIVMNHEMPRKRRNFSVLAVFLEAGKEGNVARNNVFAQHFPSFALQCLAESWLKFQQSCCLTVETFHKKKLTSIPEPVIISWNTKIAFIRWQRDRICYVASPPFLAEMFALNIPPNDSNFY